MENLFTKRKCLLENESGKDRQMLQKNKNVQKLRLILHRRKFTGIMRLKDVVCQHVQSMSKQLRCLGNSTTSNIMSTFHNMHTKMCNSTTSRVVVHISNFSLSSSSPLGEVNTAIIDLLSVEFQPKFHRDVTTRLRIAEL